MPPKPVDPVPVAAFDRSRSLVTTANPTPSANASGASVGAGPSSHEWMCESSPVGESGCGPGWVGDLPGGRAAGSTAPGARARPGARLVRCARGRYRRHLEFHPRLPLPPAGRLPYRPGIGRSARVVLGRGGRSHGGDSAAATGWRCACASWRWSICWRAHVGPFRCFDWNATVPISIQVCCAPPPPRRSRPRRGSTKCGSGPAWRRT